MLTIDFQRVDNPRVPKVFFDWLHPLPIQRIEIVLYQVDIWTLTEDAKLLTVPIEYPYGATLANFLKSQGSRIASVTGPTPRLCLALIPGGGGGGDSDPLADISYNRAHSMQLDHLLTLDHANRGLLLWLHDRMRTSQIPGLLSFVLRLLVENPIERRIHNSYRAFTCHSTIPVKTTI